MRLRTKYALVLLAILLVLGGVVLGSTELFEGQTVDQAEDDLARTTNLTATQVDENVRELRDRVASFAARPEVSDFEVSDSGGSESGGSDSGGSAAPFEEFVRNSVFNQVQLVASNGTVVDVRGNVSPDQREEIIGLDVSGQPFFTEPMNTSLHVSNPALWRRQPIPGNLSRYEITVSAPVYYRANTSVKGVLRATVRIWETGLLDPLRVNSPNRTLTYLSATANTSERVVLNEEFRSFEDPLTANASIETTGWDLRFARSRTRLTQRLQTLQVIQAGSLLAVLVSIVGLGLWQYRTNLRQTDRLLAGFDALGEGRFDHRLRMRAAEEWRQIAAGFNDLAAGLRRREEAIQEREQRLSVLNRVLRHNLQNDLTVVQGYAEMLTEFDEDEIETAREEILRKVDGLIEHGQKARRIEDALESAEEGTDDIDVVPAVRGALEDYAAEYERVEVSRDLPEYAYVDAITALEFGVESIVENAFEHNTSDDPRVAVAVERVGDTVERVGDTVERVDDTVDRVDDTVEVRVSDNGPGIPEHEYRVMEEGEETALEHGSGMGLWLAYWVVEKSGGELRFDQTDDGVTVTMAFPAGETPPDAGEESDALEF